MSYIVILMSFTAISPSIGYGPIEPPATFQWYTSTQTFVQIQS